MESNKSEITPASPQPKSPLRRWLLQTALSFAGLNAVNSLFHAQPAHAESPAPAAPAPPKPDKEAVLNDLIPREELESKYHIKVLDLPDFTNFITLNFRRSAADSSLFQKQAEANNTLYIVLINGPYLDPAFLTDEQKKILPQEGIDQLQAACEATIREKMKVYKSREKGFQLRYNEGLELLQKDLNAGKISQDRFNSDKELLAEQYLEPSRESMLQGDGGLTITPEKNQTENKYSFYAARNQEKPISSDSSPVNSEYTGTSSRTVPTLPGEPKPEQSYPKPSRFVVDPDDKEYPIKKGHTASTVVRHELLHAEGLEHPDTDYNLLKDIEEANFWMVWETPQGLTVSKSKSTSKAT